MLLSGFTFIRNAAKYDFPIRECVASMLPLVDELVINVGKSEDGTEDLVAGISSPKIRTIHSVWDDAKTDRGLILSEQTNIALDACRGAWAIYLQADEALHESEHEQIRKEIESAADSESSMEGLRLRYLHFYGGYTIVQRRWNWYPSEIRIIRRNSGARSFGDAQTFRAPDGRELRTRTIDAHVFHYGHARKPEAMRTKIRYFHRFWHGDNHGIEVGQVYRMNWKDLVWYWGSHPASHAALAAAGASWSPQPSAVHERTPRRVVLFAPASQRTLAREVTALLERHAPTTQVTVVDGLWSWLVVFAGTARSRGDSALVDLHAEDRNILEFLFWIWDALGAFRWRVAHAPNGKLCRFRRLFYSAISWGTHETADKGFRVPEERHATQLLRWIGIQMT